MQLADWIPITLTSVATVIGVILVWGTIGFWFWMAA